MSHTLVVVQLDFYGVRILQYFTKGSLAEKWDEAYAFRDYLIEKAGTANLNVRRFAVRWVP